MVHQFTVFIGLTLVIALAFDNQALATTKAQQPQQEPQTQSQPTPPDIPALREYRGVKLGMSREQVKAAMNKSSRAEKNLDEFKLGDGDLMTVHYNDQDAVKAIQLYFTDATRAPAWKEAVGDTEIESLPNGSKFARTVIQKENFWVSMFQSNDAAVTTITISR